MNVKRTLAIAGALVALGTIFVVGCNQPAPTATDKPAQQAPMDHKDMPMNGAPTSKGDEKNLGAPVAYTNAKGELVCPVLGDVIKSPEDAAGHQDYKGKRYYFCCAGCPETFAKDPDTYAK